MPILHLRNFIRGEICLDPGLLSLAAGKMCGISGILRTSLWSQLDASRGELPAFRSKCLVRGCATCTFRLAGKLSPSLAPRGAASHHHFTLVPEVHAAHVPRVHGQLYELGGFHFDVDGLRGRLSEAW